MLPKKWEEPEPKSLFSQEPTFGVFCPEATARPPLRATYPVCSSHQLDDQDDLAFHYMCLAHVKFVSK